MQKQLETLANIGGISCSILFTVRLGIGDLDIEIDSIKDEDGNELDDEDFHDSYEPAKYVAAQAIMVLIGAEVADGL